MADNEIAQQTQNNILVLCVDRDGDIEVKTGIKTPLIGRAANLDAAVSLALKDPEEPDANAMFEAVRLYDQLISKKNTAETVEVATISGTDIGGVTADRKLSAELTTILETYTTTEIIFVSDGYTDEAVLPIIESRGVPISSVRRIVIKHSESIEETAAVFTKYLKLIVKTPRYSRIALGLPGILVTVFAIFMLLNITLNISLFYYGIALTVIVGAFLLLKGFGVDTAAKKTYSSIRNYSPPALPIQISNYTAIAGILCVIVSFYLGFQYANLNLMLATDLVEGISKIPVAISYFIKGSMDLMIIGTIIILVGRSLTFYFERDNKLLRNGALIAEIAWVRMILDTTANLLNQPRDTEFIIGLQNVAFQQFVQSIVVGILIGIASILLITIISKSTTGFFKKSGDTVEQKEGIHQI
ncbi:MAG: DUF373 family protein [Candidatus Bathyarchaeota archaeon]|nr:DUF373 family protein [Candidatus Termiticorpusculum sp.]